MELNEIQKIKMALLVMNHADVENAQKAYDFVMADSKEPANHATTTVTKKVAAMNKLFTEYLKGVKKWYENDKRKLIELYQKLIELYQKLIELYRKLIELYRKLIEFLKKGGNK